MRKDDVIRVRHMLDAAKESLVFAKGKDRKDLTSNRMLVFSLIKSIEIIGEAASTVSQDFVNNIRKFRGKTLLLCETVSSTSILILTSTGCGIP